MFMDAIFCHQCFYTENHKKRVPLNMILQSKLLCRDENIREKGFCTETPRQVVSQGQSRWHLSRWCHRDSPADIPAVTGLSRGLSP